MKDTLIKNIHLFIFLYAGFNLYTIYEEKNLEIEQIKVSIESSSTKLTRSKKDLAKIDRFNKNLEESKKRVSGVVENIKKIQRQLPSEINDTEVQGILGNYSNILKMKNPQTTPKAEVPNGFYFSKDYAFDAVGTFLQNIIMLEKLENLSKSGRILNVKYTRMVVDKTADERSRYRVLNFSTIVESYRYNPTYKLVGDKK